MSRRSRMNVRSGWLLLAGMALLFGGCRDSSRLILVSGKVTLDDQPVEGAVVYFLPESGSGRPVFATTRPDGRFDLSTPADQTLEGNYIVLVSKVDISGPPDGDSEGGTPGSSKSLLPPGYGNQAKTPFRCKVPADGPLALELKSTGP
jgi:hypothetical protein